ncbi:5'-methylthioadenosine/adenosylhomocysteine nucleosidase [Leptotrichia sp. OH3620_COT-345]|uniref:5'-methylthioadenosine/adenosylhomocysteine nucleosidase n=1 Tax=Leptotrichia sp. OH3620_COT-345 TaxID=2491048 RepID=UPI000F64B270|nr:5'-methylthioadenosine/adenosylhomocysteine nucleosidase [Leptotrichia sp. OH3620_COT-345]RRD39753.1 5'-methylthioadenosine/adenosylhomocysteine nucleosidase [Leptotrichia sp. OH3620_COT-345]
MIGIIGAVIEEAEAIKNEMTDIQEEVSEGITFFKGKFCNKDVIFVQSGIGKVNAAMTATILIYKYNVDKVIFSGVAGSLDERVNIGDIVIGTDLVHHDFDTRKFGYKLGQIPQMDVWAFESDRELIEKIRKIENGKYKLIFGRILTGDQFIDESNRKERLGKEFEALCTDMEGAAVAQVCYRMNVKFLVIRSISDSLNDKSAMEYYEFVKLAANNSKEILKEILK